MKEKIEHEFPAKLQMPDEFLANLLVTVFDENRVLLPSQGKVHLHQLPPLVCKEVQLELALEILLKLLAYDDLYNKAYIINENVAN